MFQESLTSAQLQNRHPLAVVPHPHDSSATREDVRCVSDGAQLFSIPTNLLVAHRKFVPVRPCASARAVRVVVILVYSNHTPRTIIGTGNVSALQTSQWSQ